MLRLRPYKRSDATYICSWLKDEYSFHQWCADRYETFPLTAQQLNSQYDSFIDYDWFYPWTAFDETGVVGHLTMRYLDEEKQNVRLGFVIVDDEKRGKGYGKEMMQLALKYAFELLKAKKVSLGVFENNPSAYQCYKAVGFHEISEKGFYDISILGETWRSWELVVKEDEVIVGC